MRLRYAYLVKCNGFELNTPRTEVHCTYDPAKRVAGMRWAQG